MKKIQIGGVPEHFNYAWKILSARCGGQSGIPDFDWIEYHGGTGAMMTDIAAGKLDLALVLTEGAVAGISNGIPAKIVGTFVESPLIWGVHVPMASPAKILSDLGEATFAVSRLFSGSHLMTCFMAREIGWHWDKLRFEAVQSLEGARASFKEGKTNAFLWEKYTTKHLVESGEWRRVAEYLPHWPAFAVVASEKYLAKGAANDITDLLAAVRAFIFDWPVDERNAYIGQNYGMGQADVLEWAATTVWSSVPTVKMNYLDEMLELFISVGLIKNKYIQDFYVSKPCTCV